MKNYSNASKPAAAGSTTDSQSVPTNNNRPNLSIEKRKAICERWDKLVHSTKLTEEVNVPSYCTRFAYLSSDGGAKVIEIKKVTLVFRYLGHTENFDVKTGDPNNDPVILIYVTVTDFDGEPPEFLYAVGKMISDHIAKPVQVALIGDGDGEDSVVLDCADHESAWTVADAMLKKAGY